MDRESTKWIIDSFNEEIGSKIGMCVNETYYLCLNSGGSSVNSNGITTNIYKYAFKKEQLLIHNNILFLNLIVKYDSDNKILHSEWKIIYDYLKAMTLDELNRNEFKKMFPEYTENYSDEELEKALTFRSTLFDYNSTIVYHYTLKYGSRLIHFTCSHNYTLDSYNCSWERYDQIKVDYIRKRLGITPESKPEEPEEKSDYDKLCDMNLGIQSLKRIIRETKLRLVQTESKFEKLSHEFFLD